MKKGKNITGLIIIIHCLLPLDSISQSPKSVSSSLEQQLENLSAANSDNVTEDDTYLQRMQEYLTNPIDLNTAGEMELKELLILSPLQVESLLSWKKLFGKLVDLYELQALPYWDIPTIQKIRPFITVNTGADVLHSIRQRLKGGEHSILLRLSQIPERSKGYLKDTTAHTNYYLGSPQKLFVRYKYIYKNQLQYGILGEKDAGEQFFKGTQKQGFDFYSLHFFARNLGLVKSIALGDFTVNLGQGLTQWQGLGFKKGGNVLDIKRQSPVLQPYNASGEINFHRGVGITLAKNKWETTLFISYRKVDAGIKTDTMNVNEEHISSLQTSGYHRTQSELSAKGSEKQLTAGGNVSYRFKRLYVGINTVQYKFSLPIQKTGEPYNRFALSGNSFGNYSVDYSYTYKNLHIFGEAASGNKSGKAYIVGLLISAAHQVDLSFLYRNIQPGYQSLYTNAFTENTYPTNENGWYSGISIRPTDAWKIEAYADLYHFPWLKYRVNAPSTGADYLVQATYKPGRQLEIYSYFRSASRSINDNPNNLQLSPVITKPRQNWRTQVNYIIHPGITLRNRVEMVWYDKRGQLPEQGYLTYMDVLWKPLLKPCSGSIRMEYFESDSYNSRLYTYENDVLYSFSIPVLYDKGVRYYLNLNYDLTKKITVWARWAQTVYKNKNLIGSGLDEIRGNKRSECKFQLIYKF